MTHQRDQARRGRGGARVQGPGQKGQRAGPEGGAGCLRGQGHEEQGREEETIQSRKPVRKLITEGNYLL